MARPLGPRDMVLVDTPGTVDHIGVVLAIESRGGGVMIATVARSTSVDRPEEAECVLVERDTDPFSPAGQMGFTTETYFYPSQIIERPVDRLKRRGGKCPLKTWNELRELDPELRGAAEETDVEL